MATTTRNTDLRRPLYATVGVTDRAVEAVRNSIGDLQDRLVGLQQGVNRLELEPQRLRAHARDVPERIQGFLEEHDVAYDQLVTRGDALVRRIRGQKSTRDTMKAARTTSSKAKTTGTQAGNAGRSTARSAKTATATATKTATKTAQRRSKAPQSSAKATATSARRTAKSAARATADAARKVGD
ncbi:MAG TPA: hypothetical protein VHO29_10960 [Marmoricola sp.]|nr:hypothetical protein [Marmoricola sp.]